MESLLDSSSRALGEESLQMWDLNKRLEAYLARVKCLEEENEGLKAEVHRLRAGPPGEESWRAKCEEEVAAWRAALDEAFRERNAAELARAGLQEEVQQVKRRCQKEQAAREEAKRLLALSKKELEEEQRSHLWLRERAAQLEKEREASRGAHAEERAGLEQEVAAFASWRLEGFRRPPAVALQLPPSGQAEDFSLRLSALWKGAVETYKAEVSQLEVAFNGGGKESLWEAARDHRQNQLQLQSLEREAAGLRARKEALEERLARQWQHQQGEAHQLQVAIEGLEEEKQALAAQIARVLEDRRQLMHLKMALSLEVATYRTLLEAESTRLQMPGDQKPGLSLQGSYLEASKSSRQAVPLEGGSRDPRLSPTAFLKGGVAPQLPKNHSSPSTASIVSVLPRSRSPVGQEFQAAHTVLQSQPAGALEGTGSPAFLGSAAAQSGSCRPDRAKTASPAGSAPQPFTQESPLLFSSSRPLVPNAVGESSTNAEQSHPPGEDRDGISAPLNVRGVGKKAELRGEVGEEEEPFWETSRHKGPDPPQLVTEASEVALQEVHLGKGCWPDAAEAPNGLPPGDSSPVEEEDGVTASLSPVPLEEALRGLHKSQAGDPPSAGPPGGFRGSEDSCQVNGGPEGCLEQHEEAGLGVSWDAGLSSPQEAQLLEEERSPSTQRSQEKLVFDIPLADTVSCCPETRVSEQPPDAQSTTLRGEVKGCFAGTEPASQSEPDAAAVLRGGRDSPEPGTSSPEDHTGAMGPDVEETDGGAEDLEVVSTEALHLSEDEERRALSSPSRESEEECDFQAEMLESEFLQGEEFGVETLSPVSHSFYSVGSHQEHHFLGVEQQTPEEETMLPRTASSLPEEEVEEGDLEPEASSVEEALLRDEHSTNTLSAEPRAVEEEEVAGAGEQQVRELQQGDISGQEDLLEEKSALGNEDTMEKKEMATLQDWAWDQQTVLQEENVENALSQETSTREQGKETVEACQEDLSLEQQMEEEEIITKGQQETVKACQEDLSVEQQMGEEEVTSKVQQGTVRTCQEDLSVEQQVEEEEVTSKVQQGTVRTCQEDLSVEQQVEEEEVTSKVQQGTVRTCQEDLSVEQQVEEEEVTSKVQQGIEEACQEDLPVEQQMEEEEIITKGQQETVKACQEDLSVERQMEEEEVISKVQQRTVRTCQEDLSVEQQMEEEEVTSKGKQAEAYQRVMPVEEQVEKEDITTKEKQEEETVEGYQEDQPMKQQIEEKEITTKEEQTTEACRGELPVEQQMEEEEITIKGDQREETVEGYQDLSTEQQMEEEEITIKGEPREEIAEGYQEDLSIEQQMEEEETTFKGEPREETVERCQEDLSTEQHMEKEDTTSKGDQREETVEGCQEDLSTEQQTEEEETTIQGEPREETVERCQEDLSTEQHMEKEDTTSKGDQREKTVEGCQEDLSTEQQMEEEEITIKGEPREETADGYQEDLSTEQQMEEEEITIKGEPREETADGYQEDLSTEQQMEEEETTIKGELREETVEGCQEDLPVEQKTEGKGISTKGEQGDLPVEEQVEEEEILTTSPERGMLKREHLTAESEAVETEETESEIRLVGEGDAMSYVSVTDVQEKENPDAKPGSSTDTLQAGEESGGGGAAAEREETEHHQQSWQFEQSLPHGANTGGSEAPSEAQDNGTRGSEVKPHSGPQEMPASSEHDHQLQRGHSRPEVPLESSEVSPNAACESEVIEREWESTRQIELEETLPDHTPLHLYDGEALGTTGKGQPPPEEEGAAEAPLLTQDSIMFAEATEQVAEEGVWPYSPQAGNDGTKVSEGGGEERDCYIDSAPRQTGDSLYPAELHLAKDLEEAKTETLGLRRAHKEGLRDAREAEMPGVGDSSPPWDAEVEEQLGEISDRGRQELACREMAHEVTGSTDFVWETERDGVFPPDQPDPSYVQDSFRGGNDSPLECHVTSEGSHKVSPLTSVADLGEIVLEEEQPPEGQDDGAESEGLVLYGDERGPRAHGSQPIPGLEGCGRGGPTQPTDGPPLSPSGRTSAEPPPLQAEASHPMDSLKDSDILEIVEQALEFNQEVIKAADQTAEAEKWAAAQGEVLCSPAAANNSRSLASPDLGGSLVPTEETPSAPSPNGSGRLWVENNGAGLQQDSSLAEFPTEVLNGLGGLPCAHRGDGVGSFWEELAGEVAVNLDDPSPPETRSQDPPQTPTDGEAPRTGEISPEIQRPESLEGKSLFAHRMQSAHLKGKDAEEILPLESSQHLKFRPEEEEEFWSPEDH